MFPSIMYHRLLVLAAITFGPSCQAQRFTILLVIADDPGLDPVPGYMPGPQKAAMPNLMALMMQGLTFDHVWTDALCSPTRSNIITGRYGFRTGVLDPGQLSLLSANEITFYQYLANIGSGCSSCIIGKWHLGGPQPDPAYPNVMGIPHFEGLLSGAVNNYFNWPLTVNGVVTRSNEYITTALTDRAIDWIDQQISPWLCWLAYTAPHTPLHRSPLFMHDQGSLPVHPDSIAANPLPHYLAMVESVDHELGRWLSSLTPSELAHTMVIFMGDNGTDMSVVQPPYVPAQARGTLYEGGVRVPLVIAGPSILRPGEREAALVNSSDLFATIVDITGHTRSVYEDSRSLMPLFSQADPNFRPCLYANVSHGAWSGHSIRDERWKLIDMDNGTQLLFDLQNDPWETTDPLSGGLSAAEEQAYDQLITGCQLSTGSNEVTPKHRFALYPDPSSGEVLIRSPFKGPVEMAVFNVVGSLVWSFRATSSMELAELAPGLYFIELRQRGLSQFIRFVKE